MVVYRLVLLPEAANDHITSVHVNAACVFALARVYVFIYVT